MSALIVIQQQEAVYLASDGATFEVDGSLIAIGPTKIFDLPNARGAISFRGRSVTSIPNELATASFADALRLLPEMVFRSTAWLRANEPWRRDDDILHKVECVIAGWPDGAERPEVWGICNAEPENADFFNHIPGYQPFRMVELPILVASPSVALSQVIGPLASCEDVDALDAGAAALKILEAQRRTRYPIEGEPQFIVGGFGELVTIKASGVHRRRLVTWPDRVGEKIQPD